MSESILHLSAGQGPEECRWVVGRLAAAFAREAAEAGLSCGPVEPVSGRPASLLLRVMGEGGAAFVAPRIGTICWVGTSPFRPHHKRRNWFVGVAEVGAADETPDIREEEVVYQTLRASGPGGQHVNKTDSAVRAIHRPTGLVAFSQDQRSQFANKKIARLKLGLLLAEQRQREIDSGRRAEWGRNRTLERGGAVRTYEGDRFRLRT